MLRAEAEVRLREVRLESDCCKARLATLQEDFRKMEEMVQNMIQFKSRIEQLKHEKSTLTITYESKMRKYQTYIASLEKENFFLLNEWKSSEIASPEGCSRVLADAGDETVSRLLLERLQSLEQENNSLALENEQQKMQYERCLDDVANQVVQALLAQKSLREECGKLQCRVQDLEEQNRALTILFRQRFMPQASKENDWCWPVPGESTVGSADTINRLTSFEQHACHSATRTSQSEDSTESLSSLCSDYSLQSCSSGAHPVTGSSKLSSPPQWLREQQYVRPVCAASSLLRDRALRSTSPSQLELWANLLQRHDCLLASTSHPSPKDDTHLLAYQRLACLSRTPRKPQDWLNLDFAEDWRTYRNKRWSLPLSDQAQSDIADLDSMETPSLESVNFDNLPVLNSSSRLFGGSFSGVSTSSKVSSDKGASILCQLQRGGNITHPLLFGSPPPRPNTLNIVPHIMGDPAHNFSFQALERKVHTVNSSGNVYEEIDLPPFPAMVESDPGLLFTSQYSGESPNCDKGGSLPRATNTVVRRPETSFLYDSLKALDERSSFLHMPSPPLPPPDDLSPHPACSSQSPLSSGEHGKDEGYSTMSSDVQAEGNPSESGAGYAASSPPVLVENSGLQPHLVAMLSSFSSEGLMVSSVDSGLSLQLRCAQSSNQYSKDEEGFEREMDSSLIRCRHLKDNQQQSGDSEEQMVESGQLDSGLGDSPSIQKITSFRDQTEAMASLLEDKLLEDLKCHRTSLDYDKILTLLTPRGFRAPDSLSRPPSIVPSVTSEVRVQTAEKSTFTEPEEAYVECSSQGSLLSNNDFSKATFTRFSETVSCASTCSMDCLGMSEDKSTGTVPPRTSSRTCSDWQDLLDVYCVSCRYCRLRNQPPHKLKFATRLEALGSLLRAFSDSHLVVNRAGENPASLGARADSLGTRCPPLRLNLLPLERHCSAYDLSPQMETEHLPGDFQTISPTPLGDQKPQYCLRDFQVSRLLSEANCGGDGSPQSLSASTVPSSGSSSEGELVASGEEEEEEEEPCPPSFKQEITSDSENELLESNSLVEQWLQQGTACIPHTLQNGYTYDEEEIGNWSLQLSTEDLSQSSASTAPVHWSGEWPPGSQQQQQEDLPPTESVPLPCQPNEVTRLACIQENVEDDFQEDFWSSPLNWEPPRAPEAIPKTIDAEENCVPDTEEQKPEIIELIAKGEGEKLPVLEVEKDVPTNPPSAETEEDLQFEVAEFNRDFYRLCSMDSTRSLDASVRNLAGGPVCNCPDPKHHQHIHAVDTKDSGAPAVSETVKPTTKMVRSKRSHSRESGKENMSNVKAVKETSERKKLQNRSRDKTPSLGTKVVQQRKPADKTRIPVIAKSVSSQQQSKRSAIPKRETEAKEKASIPKLKQSESKIVSPTATPLRLGNYLKVPNTRIPPHPDSTKRSSSARGHSKDKHLLGHISMSKESDSAMADLMCGIDAGLRRNVEALDSEAKESPVVRKRCSEGSRNRRKRSKEGCGTSWVHFEADVDLSDPKARANLLDSMMASSSSGSSSEGEELEPGEEAAGEETTGQQQHQHLHALHRIRRHKKRVADPDAVLSFLPRLRSSIIDRHEFYYRFGEKEREAVACFDFLDDLSTSPSDVDTAENADSGKVPCNNNIIEDVASNRLSLDESKLLSCRSSPHNSFSSATLNSQECDHISLSDSCAESYSSSTQSLNRLV